jgi:(p)ppGpp synthase/HD superfamily hydrolase
MEDLKTFDQFFVYEPVFAEDPRDILEDILSKAKSYLSPAELEAIEKTYEFSRLAHQGVLRQS